MRKNLAKASKKKKKRKKIRLKKIRVITILSIIIFAIMLLSYNIKIVQKQTKEEETVSRYMSYINEAKYSEMYKMLATISKNNITEEAFIERNQTIYEQLEVSNVQTSNMKEEEENRKNKGKL